MRTIGTKGVISRIVEEIEELIEETLTAMGDKEDMTTVIVGIQQKIREEIATEVMIEVEEHSDAFAVMAWGTMLETVRNRIRLGGKTPTQ